MLKSSGKPYKELFVKIDNKILHRSIICLAKRVIRAELTILQTLNHRKEDN